MKVNCFNKGTSIRCLAIGLVVTLSPIVASAQTGWLQARIMHVKSDRVAEFESLRLEMNRARIAAGLPAQKVWHVIRGGVNTYRIVQPMGSLGEIDEPGTPVMEAGAHANWLNRVWDCVHSQELMILQNYPDLSITAPAETEVSDFRILRVQTIMPGRAQDYVNWLKDELVPALRRSGLPAQSQSRVAFGGNTRTWLRMQPIDNWAYFDGPNRLVRTLGEEATQAMFARGDTMTESSENVLLRLRRDLMAQ